MEAKIKLSHASDEEKSSGTPWARDAELMILMGMHELNLAVIELAFELLVLH